MQIKIVSGGQTGVDQAALFAAAECELTTGGWMPRGWRTLDGSRPEFADVFGMWEHADSGYAARTNANVLDADHTLLIAKSFKSAGTMLTWNICDLHGKSYTRVHWQDGVFKVAPKALATFIARATHGDPFTLNVAGNAERTAPGIYAATFDYLMIAFAELKKGAVVKVTPIADAPVHKVYETVALVSSTAPPLLMNSGVPRTPGLHLSNITGPMYEYVNKRREEDDVFRGSVYMATGFAWERIIAWAIRQVFPSDRVLDHLGEVSRDGILMSPDGYDTVDNCLEEYKATWKSALKRPPDDFTSWMWQMKAYCHALEINKARLRILHIDGSYHKPPAHFCGRCDQGPCIHTWELEFTQAELVQNWAMIVNFGKHLGVL